MRPGPGHGRTDPPMAVWAVALIVVGVTAIKYAVDHPMEAAVGALMAAVIVAVAALMMVHFSGRSA